MLENKEVKEIVVKYEDGTETVVQRGVCFGVYEKGESVYVRCAGRAGSDRDEIAVLAIVSKITKELGIDAELYEKAENVSEE